MTTRPINNSPIPCMPHAESERAFDEFASMPLE